MVAFESPLERAEVGERWHRAGGRRRRADAPAGRARRQQRRPRAPLPWRARFAGRDTGGLPGGLLLQGQLLRPRRPLALQPPDLPGAGARRPRRARHRRPRRPLPLRPGHRMGRRRSTTRSTRRGPTSSTPRCANTGPACPTARWCRTMPASGRSSAPAGAPAARLRHRPARPSTACRAWSSCSASRARASPPPGRSPARWRAGWACRSWRTISA